MLDQRAERMIDDHKRSGNTPQRPDVKVPLGRLGRQHCCNFPRRHQI
jgi:hypothetical protein